MKSIDAPSNAVLCLGLAFSDINIIWMNMSWTSKLDSEFSFLFLFDRICKDWVALTDIYFVKLFVSGKGLKLLP